MASVAKKVEAGTATYIDVEDYAYHAGKSLSKSLQNYITEDILPNGHVPQNVAEKVLIPTLRENHNMVSGVTEQVQTSLNQQAGIGLKAQTVEFDEEMAEGLVHKLTNGAFKDTKWVLGAPVVANSQSVVDRILKKNVEFQAKVGLRPKIIREAESHCCPWCESLEGTYEYGNEPKDIYRRHDNCRCTVDFKPGDGMRQNVWSKEWHEDAEPEKIEERKSNKGLDIANNRDKIEQRKKVTNDEYTRRKIGSQGQEIIDKATYNKVTRDFVKNGGVIIRGEDAERHLQKQGAYASYITGGNIAFIRNEATVSDVLEEMYHAMQDRKGFFSEYPLDEMNIRREIDAQKYLLNVSEKYKIPQEEIEVTKRNLGMYEKKLSDMLGLKG